jgi:hypothetical protein
MKTVRLAISKELGRECLVPVSKQFGDWAVHFHCHDLRPDGTVQLKDGKNGTYRCYQVTHVPTGYFVVGYIDKRRDAYALAEALEPYAFIGPEIPKDILPHIVSVLNQWKQKGLAA